MCWTKYLKNLDNYFVFTITKNFITYIIFFNTCSFCLSTWWFYVYTFCTFVKASIYWCSDVFYKTCFSILNWTIRSYSVVLDVLEKKSDQWTWVIDICTRTRIVYAIIKTCTQFKYRIIKFCMRFKQFQNLFFFFDEVQFKAPF